MHTKYVYTYITCNNVGHGKLVKTAKYYYNI